MRFGKFLAAGIPECGLEEAGKAVLEPVLLKREQAYSGPAGKLKAASAVFLLAGIICGLAGRMCLPAGRTLQGKRKIWQTVLPGKGLPA